MLIKFVGSIFSYARSNDRRIDFLWGFECPYDKISAFIDYAPSRMFKKTERVYSGVESIILNDLNRGMKEKKVLLIRRTLYFI